MNITVVGLWHLGSVTAACCARHFQVAGLDFDAGTIAQLSAGKAPILEPGLNELICSGLASKQLSFSANPASACADADILWLTDLVSHPDIRIHPHDQIFGSPLLVGDLLYLNSSNGVDNTNKVIRSPDAPSLVVLDKRT